jgi:N-acetylmuramoyl-L-alanine amidase
LRRTGPGRTTSNAADTRVGVALAALTWLSLLWAAPSQSSPTAHGAHASHGRAHLDRLTLYQHDGASLLTLDLSAPVQLRLLRLHQPERVVIDLPRTQRRAALPVRSSDSPITALRTGVLPDGALRLVLELDSAASLTVKPQSLDHGREWQVLLNSARSAATRPATQPIRPLVPSIAADGSEGAAVPAPPRGIAAPHVPRGEHDVVVVIDAGHGGVDPGAIGRGGAREKDVTLAIARVLAARIEREPGMRAVLTRDGDYFIALGERLERARKAHADFFASIHADSVHDPLISGASVYVLSERGASSEAARRLAEEENAADLRGGISLAAQKASLRSVLLDVSQSEYIGESAEAADHVLDALSSVGAVRKRGVQRAAFVVLKSPFIPSMLVETAYISNRADEERLKSAAEQQRLAEAIFQGITNYFRQYPPPGSLFAHTRNAASPASS